ncbi:MAG: hypothetical protein VR65_21955 [Desulfobulbaceae bacterium BRH_c16a]|nr:MAG: hypothetical protein VR65_21955 [Desulfobulbaceae bacterium BRH_c16a]
MQHAPNPVDLPSSAKLIKSTIVAAVVAAILLVVTILPAEYGIDPTGVGKVLGLTKMGEIKTSLAQEAAAQGTGEPATILPVQPIQDVVPKQVETVTALRKDGAGSALSPNEGREINLTLEEVKTSLVQEAVAQGSNESAATQPVQPVQNIVPKKQVETVNALRKDSLELTLLPNEGKEIKLTLNKGERARYVWYTDGAAANFDGHSDSVKHKIDYKSWQKGRSEREEGELVAEFDGKHGWFWRNRTSKSMKITLEVEGEHSDIDEVI